MLKPETFFAVVVLSGLLTLNAILLAVEMSTREASGPCTCEITPTAYHPLLVTKIML